MQHVAQFLVAGPPGSESGPVGLTQRANERIAMLPAEVTILLSMAVPLRCNGHQVDPALVAPVQIIMRKSVTGVSPKSLTTPIIDLAA
ncbi:MAG: hypothetical protein WA733_11125 [Methylocystis sp.]